MFTEPGQLFVSSADAYEIEQSCRFNDGDSPYLNRSFVTPTSAANFGYSFWVKLGAGYNGSYIISADGSGNNDNFYFNSNKINIQEGGTPRLVSNQVFRDHAAWYHFVVAYELGNSTDAHKLRVYLNGSEITSWSTDARSGLSSTSSRLNANGVSHDIGANANNGVSTHVNNFDGYLAEFHFVDGTVLTPSMFGETNSDGVWVPIKASPTYGNNGFYLAFQDDSALGDDTSGEGHDWSSSGLAAADSVSDSPTDNHCTLNPLWVDGHTLSDGNLVASAAADSAAIGTMAFDVTDSDGFYFEAKVTTAATYPNVGIRTIESPSQVGAVTSLSGNSTGRYSFTGSDGNFNDAGSSSSYGSAWAGTADKVIGVLVKAGALYFSIDGTIQNSGTAAKTGLTGLMLPTVFYDAGSGTAAAWEMRFDAADWSTTPSGYKAISAANMDSDTITTSGSFTGTGSTAGPAVYLNGVPTAMTINDNAVTFGTHADKLANGFRIITSSSDYNQSGSSNSYSVSSTGGALVDNANAQGNP